MGISSDAVRPVWLLPSSATNTSGQRSEMDDNTECIETVILGGGQAGLIAGCELKQRGREFVILDAQPRVGDVWRNRWDSLRLFTPGRDCELPGLRFNAQRSLAPTKDEMADYLEAYAAHHNVPVRNGVRATRLTKSGDLFLITTPTGDLTATNVVIATGSYCDPKLPPFADDLDPHIVQLHSGAYRNPSQLQPGGVLLVGGGNSGADISLEVVPNASDLAGRPDGPTHPAGRRQVVRADVRGPCRAVLAAQCAVPADTCGPQGRAEDARQGNAADPRQAEVAGPRRRAASRPGRRRP
jgi:cation diffusion facilitator CzcD-associated flavoprotein CzcO